MGCFPSAGPAAPAILAAGLGPGWMESVQNGGNAPASGAGCLLWEGVGGGGLLPPPEGIKGTVPARSTAEGAQLILQTKASSSMRVERELQGLSTAN